MFYKNGISVYILMNIKPFDTGYFIVKPVVYFSMRDLDPLVFWLSQLTEEDQV
jgi:hypothetical protein